MSSARIKSEPLDDEDDCCVQEQVTSMELDHMNNHDEDDDDDDDEVVREFDVYLSPHLSSEQQILHMMQYPLIQVRHHSQQQQMKGKESTQQQQNLSLPTPTTAKIRPRHCEIELEYTMPEDLQSSGGPFFIANRKYASHTIPITSHLALGKMINADNENDNSGSSQPEGLHLVPLARIVQMRPSFGHVDEAAMLAMASTDDEIKREMSAQSSSQDSTTKERQMLGIRKRESDRSIIQRKSSYAYKKQSHENELWQSLDVSGPDEIDAQQIIKHDIICSNPTENLLLVKDEKDNNKAANNNNNGANGTENDSNAAYLQTLNYLVQPTKVLYDDKDSSSANNNELSNVCTKLIEKMSQGWPMPYKIIRSQFVQQSVKDETIFTALSTVSYLVQGNFIINSKYLPLTKKVAEARTFILLLLQTFKIVHRGHLQRVFCRVEEDNGRNKPESTIPNVASASSIRNSNINDNGNNNQEYVPLEALNMVLKQVAQQTPAGWILKVEEDNKFPDEYPDVAQPHLNFWINQIQNFRKELEIYHQYQDGWDV